MRTMLATVVLSSALAGLVAAPADADTASGTLSPQTVTVGLESNGASYWRATVVFRPSVEIRSGQVTVNFGQPPPVLSVNSAASGCKSPPRSIHPCIGDWEYPEEHVSHVVVRFDDGTSTARDLVISDGGSLTVALPSGARSVSSVNATVGDAVVDWVQPTADAELSKSVRAVNATFNGPVTGSGATAGAGSAGVTPSAGGGGHGAVIAAAAGGGGIVVAGAGLAGLLFARRRRSIGAPDGPVGATMTVLGDPSPDDIVEDEEGNLWRARLADGTWQYSYMDHTAEPSAWARAGHPTGPVGVTMSQSPDPTPNDIIEDEAGNLWRAHLRDGAWHHTFMGRDETPSAWARAGHPMAPVGDTTNITGGPSPNEVIEDEAGNQWHAYLYAGAWHYRYLAPPPSAPAE